MSQEKIPLENYFSSSDLALVVAISVWFPIAVVDRTVPSKAKFMFLRSPELDSLIEAYWKKELRIEPQAYFSQLRFIKSRLYENN